MGHRTTFNPRHYKHKNFLKINNTKSKIDILFDKIKMSETLNGLPNRVTIKNGEDLDNRLLEIQNISDKIKNSTKFLIVQTEKKENKKMTQTIQYDFSDKHEDPSLYVSSDKTLSHTTKYYKVLKDYLQMIEDIEKEYSYCQNKVSESDREIQDFLHELRMPKKNASEGYMLYKLGHDLEIKRQGYKDQAIYLKSLMTHATLVKSKVDLEHFHNTLNYLDNLKSIQENRVYMPKSELKLPVGDKFRALSIEEQEFIKQNYEKVKQKRK